MNAIGKDNLSMTMQLGKPAYLAVPRCPMRSPFKKTLLPLRCPSRKTLHTKSLDTHSLLNTAIWLAAT